MKKDAIMTTYEAELAYDLLLRTEKIFKHVRHNMGLHINPETAVRLQKEYEQLVIRNADFLEEVAVSVGKPELYSDSKYLKLVKDKQFQ